MSEQEAVAAAEAPPVVMPAKAPRGMSIFARVLLFGLAISLLPLAGLGIGLININTAALERATSELHLAIVVDVHRAVAMQLERVHDELTGIGQLLLAPGLGDDDRRLGLVGSKVTAAETFDHATLYDAQGAIVGTIKAEEAEDPPVAALDDATRELATGGRLTPVRMRAGKDGPLMDMVQVVRIDKEIKGYLSTSVRLAPLCRVLAEIGDHRLRSTDGIFVVDEARRLVLAADPDRAAKLEPQAARGIFTEARGTVSFHNAFGAAPEFTDNGVPMVGAFETIPELGWAIVVQQPQAVAYASLRTMRRSVVAAIALVAIACLIAATILARRLTQPIGALSEATRDISDRRFFGLPASLTRRNDELGTLGRAFESMVRDLWRSESKLVEEARVRSSLSRYLAPDVVDLIVKDPNRLRLSGERREVTVLFADVVAFTKLAENRAPESIVALLNELFTVATEIVQKHGGMVDKFIGDCMMAVWGAPETHPDDAERAVAAAEDIRRWAETTNRRWRARFGVEVVLAQGLHTGPVVAGNLGSEKRVEYTVIGDTVNVAARLEAIAKPGQILVTEATKLKLGPAFDVRSAGERTLPGRARAEIVYEVME